MSRLGAGRGPIPRHVIALLFAVAIGTLLAWMVITALGFGQTARTMPLVVGVPTLSFVAIQLIRDGLKVARGDQTVGETSETERDRYFQAVAADRKAVTTKSPASEVGRDRSTSMPKALLWVACLAGLIWLAGMIVAIPVFMAAFMRIFGRESWITIAAFAIGTTVAVYLFFVVALDVRLYSGQLGGFLPWP
jgi:hypothetical protein